MIFVDTSAWYAIFSSDDVNHELANETLASIRAQLVTTDDVVDEALTLFRARGETLRSLKFGSSVIDDSFAEIVTVDREDFSKAWYVYRRYIDKAWSFTDCTSRVVMERLGIQKAFAFEEHFRQFGTVTVVP